MDTIDRKKVKANYVQLVRNLHPEDVTDYLYQEDVLTEADIERITAEPIRAQKTRILLERMQLRKKDALTKLVIALRENGYLGIADKIEETDVVDGRGDCYGVKESGQSDHPSNLMHLKEQLIEQQQFGIALKDELEEGQGQTEGLTATLLMENSKRQSLVEEMYNVAQHEQEKCQIATPTESESDYSLTSIEETTSSSDQQSSIDLQSSTLGLPKAKLKCVVVGDGSTGKTCILSRYYHNKFTDDYTPTVYDSLPKTTTVMHNGVSTNVDIDFWDTAGQEDYERLRAMAYVGTDVVLVTFSCTSSDSLNNILELWLPELRKHLPRAPRILVATKTDSEAMQEAEAKKQPVIKAKEADNFAVIHSFAGNRSFMTSALTGEGIGELMDFMIKTGLEHQSLPEVKKLATRLKQCSVM